MSHRKETYMPMCPLKKIIIVVNEGTNVVIATDVNIHIANTLRSEMDAFLEARAVAHEVLKCNACKGVADNCVYN